MLGVGEETRDPGQKPTEADGGRDQTEVIVATIIMVIDIIIIEIMVIDIMVIDIIIMTNMIIIGIALITTMMMAGKQ